MILEKRSFLVGLLTGTFVFITYNLYKKYHISLRTVTRSNKDTKKAKPYTTKVLFFPDKVVACKAFFVNDYGCLNFECRFSHKEEETSLGQLFALLRSTRRSIYVCVYTITCNDLVDVLIKLNSMAAEVKVITDAELENVNNSHIWKLRSYGIQVRTDNSPYYMHHKFAIIDKKILFTGSFNWTVKAITGNQEDLVIINKPQIVEEYHKEFKKLWEFYDPKSSQPLTMIGRCVHPSKGNSRFQTNSTQR